MLTSVYRVSPSRRWVTAQPAATAPSATGEPRVRHCLRRAGPLRNRRLGGPSPSPSSCSNAPILPLTALVVTFSVLPWIGIGQVLATLGDRLPRRTVMIACDLVRAIAFLVLLVPLPIVAVLALTFVAGLPSPPFAAFFARPFCLRPCPATSIPTALAISRSPRNSCSRSATSSAASSSATIGARGALVVNSLSFLASALILSRLRVGRAPAGSGKRIGISAGHTRSGPTR